MRVFLLLLVSILISNAAQCQDVSYSVKAYGSRHAVIILTGPKISTVTVSPSIDGKAVRVSGVGITFGSSAKDKLPDIITSVRVVRRGPYNDLIFNLAIGGTTRVAPGASNIQVFIKGKEGEKIEPRPVETPVTTDAVGLPSEISKITNPLPIKIIIDPTQLESESSLKPEKGIINIIFPSSSGFKSKLTITSELRVVAYSLDLFWSWITGKELEFSTLEGSLQPTTKPKDAQELDKLVEELTQELIELRNQLAQKEKELAGSKATK